MSAMLLPDGSTMDVFGAGGGTSQKAPNRCYAPGGKTYTYCSDQSSGSKSVSGGAGAGAAAGGSVAAPAPAAGPGGPVAGSGGVCPKGYPVKGSSNFKYHVPGGAYYEQTGSKNCFATPAAAEAAGYVASKR